jgi:hypothetical protein
MRKGRKFVARNLQPSAVMIEFGALCAPIMRRHKGPVSRTNRSGVLCESFAAFALIFPGLNIALQQLPQIGVLLRL